MSQQELLEEKRKLDEWEEVEFPSVNDDERVDQVGEVTAHVGNFSAD